VGTRDTLETNPLTTVLVVGGPDALIDSARRASRLVPAAEVESCELRDAATKAAQLWPFAILISEDLYAFDAAEFDALARDVNSHVIPVRLTAAGRLAKENDLQAKLLAAYRKRNE